MKRYAVHLLGLVMASIGCGETPGGYPLPVAFPNAALLGQTMAIAIDGNAMEGFDIALTDLAADTIEIEINDDTGIVSITPRAVFYGGASDLRSPYSAARPGAWIAIVLFDLPTTLQYASYPPQPDPSIRIKHHGVNLIGREPSIKIMGTGGTPHTFYPTGLFAPGEPFEKTLEPDPALRIRTRKDQGAFAWTEPGGELTPIGSIQLDVLYPACVSSPDAYGGGEATRATVLENDDGSGRVKIMLIDPEGFTLPPPEAGSDRAGRGPVLEVAFDKSCAFVAGEFDVENLLVTDTFGNVLIDERGSQSSSGQYFDLYTLNDLSP